MVIEEKKELLEIDFVINNPYKIISDLKKKYPEKFKEAYNTLKKEREEEMLYKINDVVKFPYGTKFENIETGTIYIMEQQLKILKTNGEYDYPALDEESFEENYRVI